MPLIGWLKSISSRDTVDLGGSRIEEDMTGQGGKKATDYAESTGIGGRPECSGDAIVRERKCRLGSKSGCVEIVGRGCGTCVACRRDVCGEQRHGD